MLQHDVKLVNRVTSNNVNAVVSLRDGQPKGSSFRLYKNVTNLISLHRYTAALLQLLETLPEHKLDPKFWHLQGEVLANLNRYHDALKSFNEALRLDPQAVDTHIFKAVCWIHLQEFDRALSDCEQALTLSPKNTQAWLFKGVALQRLGQYRSAYNSYDQALGTPSTSRLQQFIDFFKDLFRSTLIHD